MRSGTRCAAWSPAGLLPERAGQPVKVWAHVSLAELRALDDGSVLAQEWIGEMAVRWAARRAAASQTGSDGAAWLDGTPARAMACDAAVIPVVTGGIDPGALDDLVALCLQYAGHGPYCAGHAPDPDPDPDQPTRTRTRTGPARGRRPPRPGRCSGARSSAGPSTWSPAPAGWRPSCGPGCWAPGWPGPACRWTSGTATEIPAAIRRAVILRDQHCRWAGGCDQPASACEVHHVTHLADGGTTSVDGCALYCFFHHHVAIHQWGWTVALHPDGTTTARSPDGTKVLHSHGPPTARAG